MPRGYLKNTSKNRKISRGGSSNSSHNCSQGKRKCVVCNYYGLNRSLRLGIYSKKERNRICEMI